MSHKDAMFSVILQKVAGKLVHQSTSDASLYKMFVDKLDNGQKVEVFFESSNDDGSLAQIAKIKVCIRELAKETGDTFEDMQFQIKKASGLCFVKEIEGEKYIYCKSFGDCSKSDLSLAIQTIIQKGDFLNINFR